MNNQCTKLIRHFFHNAQINTFFPYIVWLCIHFWKCAPMCIFEQRLLCSFIRHFSSKLVKQHDTKTVQIKVWSIRLHDANCFIFLVMIPERNNLVWHETRRNQLLQTYRSLYFRRNIISQKYFMCVRACVRAFLCFFSQNLRCQIHKCLKTVLMCQVMCHGRNGLLFQLTVSLPQV